MDLKELRLAKGLTMEQLAELLGVTRQMVYNYESKKRTPSVEICKKYSEIFGVTTDNVLGLTEIPIGSITPLEPVKILKPKDEMEQQLLERFRSLTFDNKLKAISYITTLTK